MKKIINYSGITGLILIAALAFMPVSCSKEAVKDNPEADSSSQLIKVSGEDVSVATKTTLEGLATKWVATTDAVGIYSSQARTATGGSESPIVNAEFTAASDGTSSVFNGAAPMYWGAATSSHTFFSYYPWVAGAAAFTVVPVSLATNQTQLIANNNAHLGALDFMIATPKIVTSPGNTNPIANTEVSLRYNHVFTVLEFQITGSGSLSKVWVSGLGTLAFSDGTINIGQSTPDAGTPYTFASQTGLSSDVIVTLTTPATLGGTAQSVYMMINPNASTFTGELYIGLYDGSVWKYIKKAASPSGGFARGRKYIVAINAETATVAPTYSESSTAGTLIAGRFWAPKNVGYIVTTNPYGQLFQWGRKYGQNYDVTEGTVPTIVADPVAFSVGQDPANAANFYINGTTPFDWCTVQQASWATAYSPCPTGWRLPTTAELTALNSSGSTWVAVAGGNPDGLAGRWFGPTSGSPTEIKNIFLPAAGYRFFRSGDTRSTRGTTGSYWSSEVSGTGASGLDFSSSVFYMSASDRANGLPARCVRE